MANENKNYNELVSQDEDDPTIELEGLGSRIRARESDSGTSESSAHTHGLESGDDRDQASIRALETDLQTSSETINRLQFDIEQFRARWNGLEAEIAARQEITQQLNEELDGARKKLELRANLLKKRNRTIKALKAEIRKRNQQFMDLQGASATLKDELRAMESSHDSQRQDIAENLQRRIEQQAGQLAARDAELRDIRAQAERTEAYADTLRRQLHDLSDQLTANVARREAAESTLADSRTEVAALRSDIEAAQASREDLEKQVAELHRQHAEEIRTIRFELSEAQETVAQQELVAEQLASDLVDTRSCRGELESTLAATKEDSQSRISELEKEIDDLRATIEQQQEQLGTKSEAINVLLGELARKSEQIDSLVQIEDAIHEIDDRMSEQISGRAPQERDRVTRLLIGKLDGQELRFPLFKDRLTIGRTNQNDIQLQASYVSRRHAVVVTDRETTRVIDWGSKNGVFVNGARVTEHFLEHGDTVTIGTADFRYEELPRRDS